MCRIALTISVVRLPRSLKGAPSSSNCSFIQPTPMATDSRPRDITSMLTSVLAVWTSGRHGRMRHEVPSSIRSVAAAAHVNDVRQSRYGVAGSHRNLPSSVYGYAVSTRVGNAT